MPAACEICKGTVADPGTHWKVTKARPDGFWTCHAQRGKWRCAVCDHVYKPRKAVKPGDLPACSNCREDLDVFPADDGGWERAEREREHRYP